MSVFSVFLLVLMVGCYGLHAMENNSTTPLTSPRITFQVASSFGVDIEQTNDNGRSLLVAALIADIKANKRTQDGLLFDILHMPQTAQALTALEQSWIESGKQDAVKDLAMANSRLNALQTQLDALKHAQQ